MAEIHIRGVPDHLWRRARVIAAERGVPMKEIVIAALVNYFYALEECAKEAPNG